MFWQLSLIQFQLLNSWEPSEYVIFISQTQSPMSANVKPTIRPQAVLTQQQVYSPKPLVRSPFLFSFPGVENQIWIGLPKGRYFILFVVNEDKEVNFALFLEP